MFHALLDKAKIAGLLLLSALSLVPIIFVFVGALMLAPFMRQKNTR